MGVSVFILLGCELFLVTKLLYLSVIMDNTLKEYLDQTAARINVPSFVDSDPIQFPRRFSRLEDIEIVSFLASHIAWGHRKMICNNCEKLLAWMNGEPHRWLMEGAYEELEDEQNVHRTFFASSLKYMARGLRRVYADYGTMQDCARRCNIHLAEESSWLLVQRLNEVLHHENGVGDKYCFPQDMKKTALKRVNMALRWLVRDDGIVDMGVWDVITPAQLFIPLDVHVGDTARRLGLLQMSSNDKYAVLHLTSRLREMRPQDPVFYDFALFGVGVEDKAAKKAGRA